MSAPTTNIIARLPPVKFASKADIADGKQLKKETADEVNSVESSSGIVEVKPKDKVTCVPFLVEFRRLLQNPKFKSVDVIPGIPNGELFHAVVALYDVCLPDITPEVLYDTVAGKGARTLILVRDPKEVLQSFQKKTKSGENSADDLDQNSSDEGDDLDSPNGCGDATTIEQKSNDDEAGLDSEGLDENTPRNEGVGVKVKSSGDETKGIFADVFSDTDSEAGSQSDEEEEQDFSGGTDEFLKAVQERREKRKAALKTGESLPLSVSLGIEGRLVACATWEKSYIRPGEKITQIDLLAVRKRFRKLGIGKHLIQNLKDPSLVGVYDSLVVYADHSAVDFFGNFGFSDDIVLNSKYSEIADNWTNCQLMCYLPPFTGQTILKQSDPVLDLKVMELEIQKWTEKSREAYQAQYGCMMRMRHEIIALKALVSSQQDLIDSLSSELHGIQTEKFNIEKDFLHHKIKTLKDSFSGTDSLRCFPDNESDYQDLGDEDIDTDSLIQQLEKSVSISEVSLSEDESEDKEVIFRPDAASRVIDEKVAEDFKYGMLLDPLVGETCVVTKTTKVRRFQVWHAVRSIDFKYGMLLDQLVGETCVVTKTTKATLCDSVQDMISTRKTQLGESSMSTSLYFCGTLERPERIPNILQNGFSDQDMSHGSYGVGLYFSQRPSKAAHYSALGKMLLVEVVLGKTESVPKADRTRTAPPQGYQSIITPGRLSKSSSSGDVDATSSESQEFVIFDPLQAKPLFLIEYVLRP
ncbi:uncharacterized protein [Amphiura filiformis]|uniref:uncharacterized protein n=1 Tax=Amphiura filiformis TaxID=82378 RepID=UPI003B225F55